MSKLFLFAALAAAPATVALAQAPMAPATYVMKAGAGDQYEIQSSRRVLQSTSNPAIRSFADMMVMQHTKSTADVKAAAMQARVRAAPPKLDAKGTADVAALRRATGAQRDALYLTQQRAAHATALQLHQGYAANGTAAPLKAAAAGIVPVVQTHIEKLAAM